MVLDDDRKLILGIDKDNVLKTHTVYGLSSIIGEIMIVELGPSYLPRRGEKTDGPVNGASSVHEILQYGWHLLTKEEVEAINNDPNIKQWK